METGPSHSPEAASRNTTADSTLTTTEGGILVTKRVAAELAAKNNGNTTAPAETPAGDPSQDNTSDINGEQSTAENVAEATNPTGIASGAEASDASTDAADAPPLDTSASDSTPEATPPADAVEPGTTAEASEADKLGEKVEEVSVNALQSRRNEARTRSKPIESMSPTEKAAWFADPKNAADIAVNTISVIDSLDSTNFPKKDGVNVPFDLTDGMGPALAFIENTPVTLTSITGASEDGTTLSCTGMYRDADGNIQQKTFDNVPKQQVREAQIIAEREAFRSALPIHQREAFSIYADILTARATGKESPLEAMNEAELEKVESLADKAKEDETVQARVHRQLHVGAGGTLYYSSGGEAGALKHFEKDTVFKELLERNMHEAKKRGGPLTDEAKLYTEMQTVKEHLLRKSDLYVWTNIDWNTFEAWRNNFATENGGRAPTLQEQDAFKKDHSFRTANREDLRVLMDKDLLQKMAEGMDPKDLLLIIAFLTAVIGKDLAKDIMPQAPR